MSHSESITGPDGKEQEVEVPDNQMVEGLKKDRLYLSTKIEDLQAELDEKTERIMELEQVVRLNIQNDGFKTASNLSVSPKTAWMSRGYLEGYLKTLTRFYVYLDPNGKVFWDIVDGELRNPRSEA